MGTAARYGLARSQLEGLQILLSVRCCVAGRIRPRDDGSVVFHAIPAGRTAAERDAPQQPLLGSGDGNSQRQMRVSGGVRGAGWPEFSQAAKWLVSQGARSRFVGRGEGEERGGGEGTECLSTWPVGEGAFTTGLWWRMAVAEATARRTRRCRGCANRGSVLHPFGLRFCRDGC